MDGLVEGMKMSMDTNGDGCAAYIPIVIENIGL
jgi:hypothetical protein|eukprot:COSAG06_NODE_10922_length_1595_cov_11.089572_2_plen_33_part_00